MTFPEIAEQAVRDKVDAIEQRLCPDQYVGRIESFNDTLSDFPCRRGANDRPEGERCLILIIESPHIREFEGVPEPAKGNTGRLIRRWVSSVVESQYHSYGLLIMNAIQYQCSLGLPTCCFRDEVFTAEWSQNGQQSFIKRLNELYREGDVVVNCCTRGKMRSKELRHFVQQAIRKVKLDHEPLRRTHPSSWYSHKLREYEWAESS